MIIFWPSPYIWSIEFSQLEISFLRPRTSTDGINNTYSNFANVRFRCSQPCLQTFLSFPLNLTWTAPEREKGLKGFHTHTHRITSGNFLIAQFFCCLFHVVSNPPHEIFAICHTKVVRTWREEKKIEKLKWILISCEILKGNIWNIVRSHLNGGNLTMRDLTNPSSFLGEQSRLQQMSAFWIFFPWCTWATNLRTDRVGSLSVRVIDSNHFLRHQVRDLNGTQSDRILFLTRLRTWLIYKIDRQWKNKN